MRFPNRSELEIGDLVEIEIYFHGKSNIEQGKITGFLTNADSHPRGIKVKVDSGLEGRVRKKKDAISIAEGLHEEFLDDYENNSKSDRIRELEQQNEELRKMAKTTTSTEEIADDEPVKETEYTEESPMVEFKETFRLDTEERKLRKKGYTDGADKRKKEQKKNEEVIEKEVIMAIAGFANQVGGILEIGKTDDGKISEYFQEEVNSCKSWDGYTRKITETLKESTRAKSFVNTIKLQQGEDKKFVRFTVPRSRNKAIYVHTSRGDDSGGKLYVRSRSAARTDEYTGADLAHHVKTHYS